MADKTNIHTEDEQEQMETVVQGTKINGLDLVMQIYPLLKDFFCGTFLQNTNGILMKMENGQKFQLTVSEVA